MIYDRIEYDAEKAEKGASYPSLEIIAERATGAGERD
jgi:hypothetical protein